jgi:formyltetrahydrofolate-dependent phosphoribosylglycinamide formyltransferase
MASGSGTLFQALIDAAARPDYPAEIVGLVTDRPGCGAHGRANRAGIPVAALDPGGLATREEWNVQLGDAAEALQPAWLVSVGFMRVLSPAFLDRFPGRIVNSHPSLLPAFPGAHAVADAVAYGVKVTGCTVHLVDRGVDTGPILAQEPVPVLPGDDVDSLHERIKTVERRLIVDAVARLVTHGYSLTGRRAALL